MPIYSNIASTLARQGPKTFSYGYAQSLVAATHPQVFASQNRPGFGLYRTNKVGILPKYHFQNAFKNSAQSSSNVKVRSNKGDAGLDAYYEAWRKSHIAGEPEKEWTQFQFSKCIEWNPNSKDDDVYNQNREVFIPSAPPKIARSYSMSAIDDYQTQNYSASEVVALAEIDAALKKELKDRNEQALGEAKIGENIEQGANPTLNNHSGTSHHHQDSLEKLDLSSHESATVSLSETHSDYLSYLSREQRYSEIPTEFESLLTAGIQPTAPAYNALLEAAIHLSVERIHVVPKALDIYSDMLKRKVSPDTATYNILLKLLCTRYLEVSSSKEVLEGKRSRFGGIDERGKFMFVSSELEYAILDEEDRIDLIIRIYEASTSRHRENSYSSDTYHKLIAACSIAGRVPQMNKIFERMKKENVMPLATTFPFMISGFSNLGDLSSAVKCYNLYKKMAIDHDKGLINLPDRQDGIIYASLVKAYVKSDFLRKIRRSNPSNDVSLPEMIVSEGIIRGLIELGSFSEALNWAETLTTSLRSMSMSQIATAAADAGDQHIASIAYSHIDNSISDISLPTMALLALYIRDGDIITAIHYWHVLTNLNSSIDSSYIEPTAMFAVAMIGSGRVPEGLSAAQEMFTRIKTLSIDRSGHLSDEVSEGIDFVHQFMSTRGILDPSLGLSKLCENKKVSHEFYHVASRQQETIDPYSASTDFKGSAIISDELKKINGRGKYSGFDDSLRRLQNMRHAGRHPRYIVYAKLIAAAAREKGIDVVHQILDMARADIPILYQYPMVRYGWVSILDAMVGACLILGNRRLAEQYHDELLSIGASPTANTFGLYITTLKNSAKTLDEAADAIDIFNRAKSEGVQPSSFLYNALIGKLGKARRIDDCLYYFSEMRELGIRPTSVTYGTIVNALCRVSDQKNAENLFEEMESMPNYKARPAPYNSLMQFFLTTKREKSRVLYYYERMKSRGIKPTNHTYKLLVDTHATLEPINIPAAEAVLDIIRSTGQQPEAIHYSSLIHAKGCVIHDLDGAKDIFDSVMSDPSITPQACLYQSLFEAMVASECVHKTEQILLDMPNKNVEITPYIANTLIHGWANERNIEKAKQIFEMVEREKREPSTYEAMTRAYLDVQDRPSAIKVVQEMQSRHYPFAVTSKISELLMGSNPENFI
ncbi:pentatricopeptide repeat protein [Blumeria hordei DH14]|uniref:Pentatricopeptide repeat protein n=1 Tax=Blumeria graminis f. sp. hordei (strain DH14) TaxID=546991 RepID=N1J530_BLUG1|nr:pentatricopeptide repeat protein [Blumeria hordei DH14]